MKNLDLRGERNITPMTQWHVRIDQPLHELLTSVLSTGEYSGFTRLALRVMLALTLGSDINEIMESAADHLTVSAADRDELLRLSYSLRKLDELVMKRWRETG